MLRASWSECRLPLSQSFTGSFPRKVYLPQACIILRAPKLFREVSNWCAGSVKSKYIHGYRLLSTVSTTSLLPQRGSAATANMPKPGSRQKQQKSKPTHFLCFPIASESTVPQVGASLSHWRSVTDKPARQRKTVGEALRLPGEEKGSEFAASSKDSARVRDGEKDENTEVALPNTKRPTTATLEERLKILPPVVTRAPGTYHLTLGVMNLEDEESMQKALEVLHGLDLAGLLAAAEKGPPDGYKPARKWQDQRKEDDEPDDMTASRVSEQVQEIVDRNHQADKALAPIYIALTGLGGFPSLKKARVLWAHPREQVAPPSHLTLPPSTDKLNQQHPTLTFKPSTQTRLYNFGLHLIQPFRDAGLITETRPLALHATVSNMRFIHKGNKGRGGRGPGWFRSEQVDAEEIGRVWNEFEGKVENAKELMTADSTRRSSISGKDGGEHDENDEERGQDEEESGGPQNFSKEFIWIQDVEIDRVAICKLGATKHQDPIWGEWYPAIENGERLISEK